ncbi:MAG: hypothetical protein ACYDA8_00610 [Deferrisomatales bacterium]
MGSRVTWIALGAAALLVLPGLGRRTAPAAEPAPPLPRLFGSFDATPGAWAQYAVVDKDTGRRSKMKMAIVGQEGPNSWYEVLNEDGADRNVVKMLVGGDPENPDNIRRMIIKSGDSPATEMPKDFVAMGRRMAGHMFERRSGVPAHGAPGVRLEVGERRPVTVPAGRFEAEFRRIVDADGKTLATYDYDARVLPFGVVTSDTQGTSMELLAYGRDATSLITEEPIKLTGPPGMPAGMPRGLPPGFPVGGPKAP